MKILKDIISSISKQKYTLDCVNEKISHLTDEDFPLVILDKLSHSPKLFTARYFFNEEIKANDLSFIKVVVSGENFSKTYDFEDFRKQYVEYSKKYIRLHFGDDV